MADVDATLLEALAEADPVRRRRLLVGMAPGACARATLTKIVDVLRGATEVGARTAAMEVLAALGEQAMEVLGGLLDDPGPGVRRLAVDVLGLMSSRRAMPLLRRAATDPSTTVRAAALEGVARVGGDEAAVVLRQQLEGDVPTVVALAALLGAEQLAITLPSVVLTRWVDDPLTAGASLRLLGRAGEYPHVLKALAGGSRLRLRAALAGLADGLERGCTLPAGALSLEVRERIVANVVDADADTAGAGVIVLAHVGDLAGVAAAVRRSDHSRLLPALHRAVAEAARQGVAVEAGLAQIARGELPAVVDIVRELEEAARRRSTRARAEGPSSPRSQGLDEAAFTRLSAWFSREAGLAFSSDARTRLEARLSPRVEARGAVDFPAYLDILQHEPDEAAIAIDAVTVHETYFFREPASLEGLRDDIAPVLGSGGRPLQVWSAGCSSGEEPYTLAAILAELEAAGRIGAFDVLGTDVSPTSIAWARRGRYAARSFRAPLDAGEERLFDTWDDGTRSPRATLRERVRFDVVNLVDAAAMSRLPQFDIIFCRNVLIYMTSPARRAVLQGFHQHLRPGGALVLGHSESLLHVENPFDLWPMKRGLAYRRSPG